MQISTKKKNSKIIPTIMMEYRHCVCVPPGTYSTPNGVGQTGKDRLQKGLTVNSDTVVLGT